MPPRNPLRWERDRMPEDVCMTRDEVREGDIVVPVMGQSGSGKSSFINCVLGKEVAPVSDGFASCTQKLQHYVVEIREESQYKETFKNRRLILVDTPGFDDTHVNDGEILRRIAVWLASSYSNEMKVGGVIYTFPLYPGRISCLDRANLKVFQQICGETNLTKVVLATTCWDANVGHEVKVGREDELRRTFWKDFLGSEEDSKDSALLYRLEKTSDSAWGLVDQVLRRLSEADIVGGALHLQEQLVDKRRRIADTDAAHQLLRKGREFQSGPGSEGLMNSIIRWLTPRPRN